MTSQENKKAHKNELKNFNLKDLLEIAIGSIGLVGYVILFLAVVYTLRGLLSEGFEPLWERYVKMSILGLVLIGLYHWIRWSRGR